MRAAAIRAAALVDPESFVAVLAGMVPDRHWRVRAASADALGTLPAELVVERLRSMLQDDDKRVIPSVLSSLAKLKVPDLRRAAAGAAGGSGFRRAGHPPRASSRR